MERPEQVMLREAQLLVGYPDSPIVGETGTLRAARYRASGRRMPAG